MLLVFDIGNTHTTVGLFNDDELVADWRMRTDNLRTTDETAVLLLSFFTLRGLEFSDVTGAAVCSVVPPASFAIVSMIQEYLRVTPVQVEPGVKTGLPILYENPREVGADRIVNSVGALARYTPPLIIVDFGTATTFDCVSAKGEYLGGVITPGVAISADALFERASKLPRIEILPPPSVLGRTTVQSMQSGLFFGTVSMVEGMVRRLEREMGGPVTTIATGGLAAAIVEHCDVIQYHEPHITLLGLLHVWKKNRRSGP